MPEVRNAAGSQAVRSADFVILGLWPSRGLELQGVEVKSHRGDWLSELKNPAKAEAIYKFCDRWWILAMNENICKKEELPKTWGLMVVKKGSIKFEVPVPLLSPQPADRSFIASMLKRASDGMIPRHTIRKEIQEARDDGYNSAKLSVDRAEKESRELREMVKAFESTSGVRINRWEPKELGQAVHLVLSGGVKNIRHELEGLQGAADAISKKIKQVLEEIK